MAHRPRSRHVVGATAVLALHLLLALVWLSHQAPPDRQVARISQQPLLVRLWPGPAEPPTARPTPPASPRTPRARPQRQTQPPPGSRESHPQARRPVASAEPQAITLPAEPPPAAAAADPPAVAAPAVPPPLDLRLPLGASAPWRAQNPARTDPRANSSRPLLEERLAAAMGGDISHLAEEHLGPDEIRFRRGSRCVLAKRSRAGQLGLANGAFRDLWQVGPC